MKDKFNKSSKHSIEFNEFTYGIFTNTGHFSNFSYSASPVTVDAIMRGFQFFCNSYTSATYETY